MISCDEAGFTGDNLLNSDQPFFSYASHDLTLPEAESLVRRVRAKHPVQMPELKAAKLLKTLRGKALIADILRELDGRYIVTLYDKRYSLAAKLFEYLFEPVLQSNNALFYRHNFHRFIAMFFFMLMRDKSIAGLASEFEAFMRSLDPADAPSLFNSRGVNPMIEQILRFVRGYNVIIARETRDLQEITGGKWILDLTVSAIFSHLVAWGKRHPLIEVVCDDSKPLRALSDFFDVMINRPDTVRVDMFGKRRTLTWNMSRPIAFTSSASHSGVQIADLLAGVTAAIPAGGPEMEAFGEMVQGQLHEDCVLPDFSILELDQEETAVNWLVLEDLAYRADNGFDPLHGMEMVFELAKQSFPDFQAGRFMRTRPAAG